MSDTIDQAVAALNEKMSEGAFDGTAKFVIEDEGTIMVNADGATAGDDDAEVTLTADADTFREILDGSLNPTSAVMTGRLTIDGDMSVAMRLAPALG